MKVNFTIGIPNSAHGADREPQCFMKVIILLAGYGTRLRPHTYTKPKPLINVAGKPVLGHILDKLIAAGVQTVTFVVGYLSEQIQDYVLQTYPQINASYVEQRDLNGQVPAILLAEPHVNSGPVFVVFGDTLAEVDLSVLGKSQADGVIYTKAVEDPRRFGVVKLTGDGTITRLIEKPAEMTDKQAVIGLYYVRDAAKLMAACHQLVDRKIQTKGEYYLADALNLMIDAGATLRSESVSVWLDAGKPEAVLESNRYLLGHGHDNSKSWLYRGFIVVPPVHIHPSARIEASVIGPNATIGEGCHISNSVIRDSIVDANAEVIDNVLANSLIGRDAILHGRPRKFNIGDSSVVGFDEE